MQITKEVTSMKLLKFYYFRFPFIASEIFNCEINQILDKFFEQPEIKEKAGAASDQEEEEDEEKHVSDHLFISIVY